MPVLNRRKKKQRNARRRTLALSGAGIGAVGLIGGGALLARKSRGASSAPLPTRIVEINRSQLRSLPPSLTSNKSEKVIVTPPVIRRRVGTGSSIIRYQLTTALMRRKNNIRSRLDVLGAKLSGSLTHVKGKGKHYANYIPVIERLGQLRRRSLVLAPAKTGASTSDRIAALIAMLGANFKGFHWLSCSVCDRF